eukprot:3522922-Pleurochrysis_carterae.AAC.2
MPVSATRPLYRTHPLRALCRAVYAACPSSLESAIHRLWGIRLLLRGCMHPRATAATEYCALICAVLYASGVGARRRERAMFGAA